MGRRFPAARRCFPHGLSRHRTGWRQSRQDGCCIRRRSGRSADCLLFILKGASEVYVVDNIPERLQKAKELGADSGEFQRRRSRSNRSSKCGTKKNIQQDSTSRRGKDEGVDCAIDAVGYQAHDDKNPSQENPTQALENALRVVNPTGSVGVIGVYIAPDPGAKDENRKKGIYPFPMADFFYKGITMGSGQAPVKKYNEYLRDLIVNWSCQA